jgi:uncharacterized membrane protein
MGAAWAIWGGIGLLDPRILTVTILLTGSLLLGALVLALVDRWRKRQDEAVQPHEQLTSFRVLYERGELSEQEYQRVKAKLTPKLKPAPVAPTMASSPTSPAVPEAKPENLPETPPMSPDTRIKPAE